MYLPVGFSSTMATANYGQEQHFWSNDEQRILLTDANVVKRNSHENTDWIETSTMTSSKNRKCFFVWGKGLFLLFPCYLLNIDGIYKNDKVISAIYDAYENDFSKVFCWPWSTITKHMTLHHSKPVTPIGFVTGIEMLLACMKILFIVIFIIIITLYIVSLFDRTKFDK